jgi:hypothetical protein
LEMPRKLKDNTFIENNGFVSIHATNCNVFGGKNILSIRWEKLADIGYTGHVLRPVPLGTAYTPLQTEPEYIKKNANYVEYDFYTFTAATPKATVFTLPTHPLNNKFSMRYGVSVDNGPLTIVDFKTVGRSEEWKQNVLSNRAKRTIPLQPLKKGRHTLKVYCIDPGVLLDEIRIDLGGLKEAYSTLPETKAKTDL